MTIFDARGYWESRYAAGGTSGAGSSGALALAKATFLNRLVETERITSVVDLGCGDGEQLALASYPSYTGLDVSPSVIAHCRERYRHDSSKRFALYEPATFDPGAYRSELALSLDVVYHVVPDADFERHMEHLFACAERHVVVYGTNVDEPEPDQAPHIRHRRFTRWVSERRPHWMLARRVPVRANATAYDPDFFLFEPRRPGPSGRWCPPSA